MITPQDIREKTFEKAVFGGYDMSAVDDFLEECANDLTLLQKENATLRAKMKVLVDKIEEYRDGEDTLRSAILSVQRMGALIETEAREKSDKMLSEAQEEALRITGNAAAQAEDEKRKLAEAKRTSVEFIDKMNMLCQHQMDILARLSNGDLIREARESTAGYQATAQAESPRSAAPVYTQPDAPVAPPPAEIHEAVKSIEETVARVASEPPGDVHPDIQAAAASLTEEKKAAPPAEELNKKPSDGQSTRPYDIISGGASSEGGDGVKTNKLVLEKARD